MSAVPFSLSGRHVAVAGSSGLIGAAVVSAAVACGARVTRLDCRPSDSDPPEAAAGQTGFSAFDVSAFEQPEETLSALEDAFGPFDVWINCAYPRTENWGRPEIEKAAAVEAWRRNIDLQLNSTCVWAAAMAERMAARGGGVIVAIGSIYGEVAPDPTFYEGLDMTMPSAYAAVKGGVSAYMRLLARRFAPTVRVNVLSPGGVQRRQPALFQQRYGARTCLGRLAEPMEVAWPAVFLASDAASYITGAVLMVDGGFTCM